MIKKILILMSITILASCKSETKETAPKKTIPHYGTVREMLSDASDFYEENGSLKFISEDKSNFHIQVSKPAFKSDLENVKQETVKRDIVYVAFQTFAQTNLDELTITSVPLDNEEKGSYLEDYKKTIKIERALATSILKKYLNSNDFSILYTEDNGIWLPNSNFSKLKFEKLNEVFDDISQEQI